MRTVVHIVAAFVVSGGLQAYGQNGDAKASLQQALSDQFPLTQMTRDRSDVVSTGAVLVLQKGGLMTYSTASPMPPTNSYRNGKISQGGSGFGRDMLITMAAPGNSTAAAHPHRQFVAGEKLWVTGLSIQKTGIVFQLLTDLYNGVRYYGELKFPFEKGSVPAPDQALATIAEVLTVEPAGNSTATGQAAQHEGPTVAPVAPSRLPATYTNAQTPADKLQLNADNTFSLQEAGQSYSGTFSANGGTIELNIRGGPKTTLTIQGNNLTDGSGQTWVSVQ